MFESFQKYFQKAAKNRGMTRQITAAQVCNAARKEIEKQFTNIQDHEKSIKVLSFKEGKLSIATASPLWSQQVNLRKVAILKQINDYLGQNLVKKIVFQSSLA
jgi:predicted nucleic acid-binding Zn ribbon protein